MAIIKIKTAISLMVLSLWTMSSIADDIDRRSLEQNYLTHGSALNKSLLYKKIHQYFQNHYEEIAARKLKAIEQGKKLNVWGGLNHLGINYTHKFVDFSVAYKRDLAPDLFDDERWIVTDNMEIIIDASALLGHLQELEVIDFSDDLLAAYAGLKFKRKYQFIHYAESYEKGVAHNLDRLFFSFLNFQSENFLQLNPYEILTKEDSIAFNAGALVNVHIPQTVFSVQGGAHGEFQRLAKLQLQAVGEEDQRAPGEYLRLSYEKSKMVGAQAHLALMAGFFDILKMTVLSLDFEYQLEESHKVNLAFTREQLFELADNQILKDQIKKVIKNDYPVMEELQPYLVSDIKRKTDFKQSKYRLLLMGQARKKRTQFIQAVKDEVARTFYRHYFEVEKFTKSLSGQVLNDVLQSLFQIESVVADIWAENKSIDLEYQSERDLMASQSRIQIDREDVLMISMASKYYAYSFNGYNGRKYKDKIVDALSDYSGVDPLIYDGLDNGDIRPPLRATINYNIRPDGLLQFSHFSAKEIYALIDDICRSARAKNFFVICRSPLQKAYEHYFYGLHHDAYPIRLYDACDQLYESRYGGFDHEGRPKPVQSKHKYTYLEACIKLNSKTNYPLSENYIPVHQVRKFLQVFHQKSVTKRDLYNLFGYRNVTINGKIQAYQRSGFLFYSHFKEGMENSKSLVDQFLEE